MNKDNLVRLVSTIAAVVALHCAILESSMAATVFHLRFEDDASTDVIDTVSGLPVGVIQEGTVRCDDTPGPTRVNGANALALDSQRGNGAKITGATLPFIFHDNEGDATLEFYAKVPAVQPHSSLFWTENGPPGAAGRFNIFWEAGFAGVNETVAGDVGGPDPIAGTPAGAADWDTLPNSDLFPTEEWFHVAIVRTDLDGGGGNQMGWEWYLNGAQLAGHGAVSFVPMPSPINDWLVATRPGCCDFRGFMDEIRGSDSALAPEDFLFNGSINPTGGNCQPDASELTIRDAWYRWEDGAGDEVRNALDNNAVDGTFTGSYTDDTVGEITDGLTGNTHDNNCAYESNGVEDLCTITKTSFVLHKADGDATFETLVKVRSPNPGDQSIVWSNPGSESNRFNIIWNANFVASPASNRFVSGDFQNGPGVNIAANNHDVGNPQPLDQWFHMAIVRTDNGDTSFDWNWYFNGSLSPTHAVTTPPGSTPPTAATFLIAARNFTGHRLLIDEFRMMQQALTPSQFMTANGLVPEFRADADFTTAANPNGAWSYHDGDGDLITTVVSDWQSGDLGANQEADADTAGSFPGWALANGNAALDLPPTLSSLTARHRSGGPLRRPATSRSSADSGSPPNRDPRARSSFDSTTSPRRSPRLI